MKYFDKLALPFCFILALSIFPSPSTAEELRIGATPIPHAEILEFVKPTLKKQGITLNIEIFNDYVQPNLQLVQKKLDANFFQHKPYLDKFNNSRKAALVSVTAVHIEPFGAYSKKIENIDALAEGATVAIPNDAVNGSRALLLLAAHDLIRLKRDAATIVTVNDIVSNPRKLRFHEIGAADLPRALGQVDLALINTNYALEAGLDPLTDALIIENARSPYVNILVARPDNATSEALEKLAAALTSPKTRKFIEDRYKGAVHPVF
jgi:D-methionine transport system substrate-binding protein